MSINFSTNEDRKVPKKPSRHTATYRSIIACDSSTLISNKGGYPSNEVDDHFVNNTSKQPVIQNDGDDAKEVMISKFDDRFPSKQPESIIFRWNPQFESKAQCDTLRSLYLVQITLNLIITIKGGAAECMEHFLKLVTNLLEWHNEDTDRNVFDGKLLAEAEKSEIINEYFCKIGDAPKVSATEMYDVLMSDDVMINEDWMDYPQPELKLETFGWYKLYKNEKVLRECTTEELVAVLVYYNDYNEDDEKNGDPVKGLFQTMEEPYAVTKKTEPLLKLHEFGKDMNGDDDLAKAGIINQIIVAMWIVSNPCKDIRDYCKHRIIDFIRGVPSIPKGAPKQLLDSWKAKGISFEQGGGPYTGDMINGNNALPQKQLATRLSNYLLPAGVPQKDNKTPANRILHPGVHKFWMNLKEFNVHNTLEAVKNDRESTKKESSNVLPAHDDFVLDDDQINEDIEQMFTQYDEDEKLATLMRDIYFKANKLVNMQYPKIHGHHECKMEMNKIDYKQIEGVIEKFEWQNYNIYHSKYPQKGNPPKITLSMEPKQLVIKIKESTHPIKDCCVEDIMFILTDYAFEEIKCDKVKFYQQVILSYFVGNKIDGKALINLGGEQFTKNMIKHNKKNKKVIAASKKIYSYLMGFDYNRINEHEGNLNLIPFVMNDGDNKHWIEHMMMVNIRNGVDIGVSIRSDDDDDDEYKLKVTGIHLDKEPIMERHKLVSNHHDENEACKCLDGFNFVVDELDLEHPQEQEMRNEVRNEVMNDDDRKEEQDMVSIDDEDKKEQGAEVVMNDEKDEQVEDKNEENGRLEV